MSFPPKLITVLCLLQFLFITGGFLLTRSGLKLYNHVVPGMLGPYAPPTPALANFVRDFGLWFLLVPLLWSLVAATRAEVSHGITSITLSQLLIGSAITILLIILFSTSAACAFSLTFRAV